MEQAIKLSSLYLPKLEGMVVIIILNVLQDSGNKALQFCKKGFVIKVKSEIHDLDIYILDLFFLIFSPITTYIL